MESAKPKIKSERVSTRVLEGASIFALDIAMLPSNVTQSINWHGRFYDLLEGTKEKEDAAHDLANDKSLNIASNK